mmetsp:Transcript_25250/g.66706  ORF Transcript_25250/g.66706 Transcript_25250/m.66706 type:complete len:274 (-) Transcript_25250:128-949(-)
MAVRLPAVAWESLGNDADDLWEACVARQDLVPTQPDPDNSDLMEDVPDASMLVFHSEHFEECKDAAPMGADADDTDFDLMEAAQPTAQGVTPEASKAAPPTQSKTRRRIFRDVPTLSPKAGLAANAPADASPVTSPMSRRSRQRLTGSESLPSLRAGFKFSSKGLQDYFAEADVGRSRAPFAEPPAAAQPSWLGAAPPSEGSAMARDLGLSAGPPSSPSRAASRALLPSASAGLLPQLSPGALGAKGRAQLTRVQASGHRSRLWDLDSTFVAR